MRSGTLPGGNLSNWVCSPSEKGSTLKGKNSFPLGTNYFPLEKSPFRQGLGVLERKQEFTIIYFFVKMLEHLLGTASRTVYITVQWPNRKRPDSVHHRTNSVLKARCRLKDSLRMRFTVPGEERIYFTCISLITSDSGAFLCRPRLVLLKQWFCCFCRPSTRRIQVDIDRLGVFRRLSIWTLYGWLYTLSPLLQYNCKCYRKSCTLAITPVHPWVSEVDSSVLEFGYIH